MATNDPTTGRLTKISDCSGCNADETNVQWDRNRKAWLCLVCWPPKAAINPKTAEYNKFWDEEVKRVYGGYPAKDQFNPPPITASDLLRRNQYGIHVDDSHVSPGDFRVICHLCGIIGDSLTIHDARMVRIRHEEGHVDTPPEPVEEESAVAMELGLEPSLGDRARALAARMAVD